MSNFWNNLERPFTALAPMEDVTDTVYRRLIAAAGRPDVFYTEFTSSDGLFSRGREKVIHRLQFTQEERPLVAQIWGTNPENHYRAAKLLVSMGFDGIDLNMGCPVPKIVKSGACSALIDRPELAKELYLATCEGAGSVPVSIKTRLGFNSWKTEEWIGFVLGLAPAALIVHGRIARDMSSKPANWSEIGRVVTLRNEAGVPTRIVGNGDVLSYADVIARSEESGVDGVMIGRGVFQNIFVFRKDGREQRELSQSEQLQLLMKHIELFEATWSTERPFRVLKKFFKNYAVGFRGASALRMQLVEADSAGEVRMIISDWLSASGSTARC